MTRPFLARWVPAMFLAVSVLTTTGASEPGLGPCKCRDLTFEDYVQYASVIATGVVTDTDDRLLGPWWCRLLSLFSEQDGDCRTAWVTLRAKKVWKGEVDSEFGTYVDTAPAPDGCGPSFREGQEYLVFLSNTIDGPFTSTCNGTRLVSDADEFLQRLGAPKEIH